MPYIPADVVSRVKQMDLYTYLRNYEPQELVHVGGGTYFAEVNEHLLSGRCVKHMVINPPMIFTRFNLPCLLQIVDKISQCLFVARQSVIIPILYELLLQHIINRGDAIVFFA